MLSLCLRNIFMVKKKKYVKGKLGKAQTFFDRNRLIEAREICLQLCNVSSDNSAALFLLGQISMRMNNYVESEMFFSRVVVLDKLNFEALHNKGLSQVFLGRPNDAFTSFQKALAINPEYVTGYASMGCLLRDFGQYEQAEGCFRHALKIEPNHLDSLIYLANLLMFTSEPDVAYEYFERAQKVDPKSIAATVGKATVLEKKRKYEESYSLIKPLIDRGVTSTVLANLLASLAGKFPCEKQAITMMEKLVRHGSLAPIEKESMYFALGKLYDQLGQYEKAFRNIDKANKNREHVFDIPAYKARIYSIKKNYDPDAYARLPLANMGKQRPIFIVGMPRSGTTLVEQILASHDGVSAGGELPYLELLTEKTKDIVGAAATYPDCMISLDQKDVQMLADHYTDELSRHADGFEGWVTDKMPMNYMHLGLISKLFPGSPILHCVRNPLDICISCYFQNFGERHPYIYSLEKLGEVYNLYEEITRFWKTELEIPMLDVQYESLVSDPEKTVRKILDHCGLKWDARCLSFHSSKRYAHTASYDQVRQPIYLSSVARWRNYEKQIAGLMDMIGSS